MWAVIFLVNPFVLNAAAWDFHPITMAVPFVALGMLAVELKNFKMLLFCSLFILLCKEHLGIMVVGFGLLWWLKNKEMKKGLILGGIGLIVFYLVLMVIMPYFSPTGNHIMISEGHGHLSRYSWLGNSLDEIIKRIISDPIKIARIVLFPMGGLFYLILLFVPFFILPLLNPILLLPAFADLGTNLLSSISMPRLPVSYHSATIIPILVAASIYSLKIVKNSIFKKSNIMILTLMIFIFSILFGYKLSPFPLFGTLNFWAAKSYFCVEDRRIEEIKKLTGNNSSLSVQANIGSYFSQRQEIYRFPEKLGDAKGIILYLDSPTKKLEPINPGALGTLSDHLQLSIPYYLLIIEKLLSSEKYNIVYWNDPWLVFSSEKNIPKIKKNEVIKKIKELRKKWLK